MSKTTHDTIAYFKNKADKYDLVEEQAYWQLSDQLLWNVFKKRSWIDYPLDSRF